MVNHPLDLVKPDRATTVRGHAIMHVIGSTVFLGTLRITLQHEFPCPEFDKYVDKHGMTSIEIEKTWIGWMKPTTVFAMRLTDLQLKTDPVMISVQRHAEKWVRWTDADIVKKTADTGDKALH